MRYAKSLVGRIASPEAPDLIHDPHCRTIVELTVAISLHWNGRGRRYAIVLSECVVPRIKLGLLDEFFACLKCIPRVNPVIVVAHDLLP